MNSDRHADLLSYKLYNKNQRLYDIFTRTQVFDRLRDPDQGASLLGFLADVFFNYRIRAFHNQFRQINLEIHEQITGGKDMAVIYDSETIEQLKSLGYIQ